MKTSSPPLRRASMCRRLLSPVLAVLALLSLSAAPGLAVERTYRATWSGASFGNSARAVARVVIDEALLLNPGSEIFVGIGPGTAIQSIDITVSDASVGNGTWTTTDYSNYALTIVDALDLSADWVGQPQPSVGPGVLWGGPSSGEFNVFSSTIGAPHATDIFQLSANGGLGDQMRLTSFAPYSFGGPGAHLYLGDTVDLNLTLLIAGELAPQPGQNVRMLGLPAGMSFDPATMKITGQALGLVGNAGVKIQVRQGSRVLRTLIYNLLVEPYKFAGGFEVLLESGQSAFGNTDGITIPSSGNADPYPSTITVPPLTLPGSVNLRVKLNGFSHTWPSDVDIFLVAPNGAVAVIMSDAGSSADAVNADLVFEDSAATPIQLGGTIVSGTYRPADYSTVEPLPPGAVGPLAPNLNALLAGGVAGDWKLFVSDDTVGDSGSMTSWELEFDYGAVLPSGKIKVTVASPTRRSPNPAFTAVMERLGEPRRVSRGQITMLSGAVQPVVVSFPATRTLPAAEFLLALTEGSDLVTGASLLLPAVQARGFRLVQLGRIPSGNPALTMLLQPSFAGDGVVEPGGLGHATATVNSRALVRMRGRLGDYQPFTTSLCLSHTNQAVFWLTPYRNKLSYCGGIMGINDFIPGIFLLPGRGASEEISPPGLTWRMLADARSKSYPDGFGPLLLFPQSGRWNPVPKAEALAQSLGLDFRSLYFQYFQPMPLLPENVRLRDNLTLLTVAPTGAALLSGRANGRNGSLTGTLRLPPPATRSSVSGVFSQEVFFGPFIGGFALKVPISGPGIARGSYRTYGGHMFNTSF